MCVSDARGTRWCDGARLFAEMTAPLPNAADDQATRPLEDATPVDPVHTMAIVAGQPGRRIKLRGPKGPRRAPGDDTDSSRTAASLNAAAAAASPPDEEAYAGFNRGDEVHIATVFRYWYDRLVEYIEFSFQVRFEDAQDIAQQAFIKALRSQPDREVSVPARLFTIARSEALTHRRTVTRRTALLDVHASTNLKPSTMPDELTHRWMQFDAILQALRGFPDDEHRAFLLRRVEGWSYADISVLMGWDTRRTAATVHQTWLQLRRLLGVHRTT
jgi:RNA polymerase sigma factor (sigma-70 family)